MIAKPFWKLQKIPNKVIFHGNTLCKNTSVRQFTSIVALHKKRNALLESSYKDISTWEGHKVTVKMPTYIMLKNGKKKNKETKIDKSYWLEDVFCNIGFCPLTKMFEFFFLLMSSNLRSIACRNYLFEVKRGLGSIPHTAG